MIGVFDSGDGGLLAVEKIRERSPECDLIFLADRENAPYGTKSRTEIIRITKRNIKRLKELGASRILIACCTASSIYGELSEEEKSIAVPIILPSARRAASITKTGKFAVISTEATAKSGAFERALKSVLPTCTVYTEPASELVSLIENGLSDNTVKETGKEKVRKILSRLNGLDFDTLILGCTHFPRLEKTISEIFGVQTVSSALVGAEEILKTEERSGNGITLFV